MWTPWPLVAPPLSGAANMPSHKARSPEPVGDVPGVHSDYAFFRKNKGEKENTATVLVLKDRKSKGICAHVVPKKGVGGGFVVKQFDRDIKKFGYGHKVMLRSDGEPAIKDLLQKVRDLRASETICEQTSA